MPTVPENFAPSVSENPLQAVPASSPWARPMQNAAPGQLQQTGEAAAELGATGARIGNTIKDRTLDMFDSAQSLAAQNQFVRSAMPVLSQYRTTEGMNATTQLEPTQQALTKAREDARANLTNPIQQRSFDLAVNDHMMGFQQQMLQHQSTEGIQYSKQQGSDSADTHNGLAVMARLNGDMAGYRKNATLADADTLGVAQLSGAAPDSDVAQAMLRAKRSSLTQAVVLGLIDQHAVSEADQHYQSVLPSLDLRTADQLGRAIKSAQMQEDSKVYEQQTGMAVKGVTGPGVLQPLIPGATISTTTGVDGIDIHTAPGTPVRAPASGTVSKVWMDPQMGRSMQITLLNGYIATVNGLAAANYEEGQKITVGQVLGQTGKNDAGAGVLHYAMTGPDGKYIDPRQASSAPLDPRSIYTAADEEKGVDWIRNNVADPNTQEQTLNLWRRDVGLNRQLMNQQHTDAVKQASDYSLQHGFSLDGLPPSVRSQLTPDDILQFSRKAHEVYELGQEGLHESDVNLRANWLANPGQMTVDAVRQAYAQGKLSDDDYQTSLREATSLQNNPKKVQQTSLDHDQLTSILANNQLPNLAQPVRPQDRLARVQLETTIKNEIAAQEQRNNRPLDWQEKGKIARDIVIDKVYTPGAFTTGSPRPVTLLTPDQLKNATVWVGSQKVRMMDIPPQQALAARQELEANGRPATQANIAALWLRKGKPAQ